MPSANTTPVDTISQNAEHARALVEHLYKTAVLRAMPAHTKAAGLPEPPAPDTLARAADKGVKIADQPGRNDAYGFFEPIGDMVFTGPTFTNMNDFRAILVL